MSDENTRREQLRRLSKSELVDEVLRLEASTLAAPPCGPADKAMHFSDLLDAIPAFVNVKDRDGRYVFVNRHQAQVMDLPADQQIGKTTAETLSPEHFEHVNPHDAHVLATGETVAGIVSRLQRPDGRVTWLNVHKAPVMDTEGRPRGIISVGIDVTRQHEVETALQDSRRLMQEIIDAAPLVVTVKDPDGRYVFANRFAAERMGMAPHDLIGRMAGDVVPEGMADDMRQRDQHVVRTGDAFPFFEETVRIGGEDHVMMTSKTPVMDGDGAVAHVVTVALEVTEMKRAEERLREVETQFSALVEQSPTAVYIKDLEGRYLLTNQPFIDMFIPGGSAADVLGLTIFDIASRQHAERASALDRRVIEAGEAQTDELTEVAASGRVINTLVHKFPLTDADGRTVAIGTFETDITSIAEARTALMHAKDDAEAASRAKSQFLATMSHELRTPLNSIIGFSSLIAGRNFGEGIDERYRQYAEDIHVSGLHLLEVINDILDVARIEAGSMTLNEQDVDVADVVRTCCGMVNEAAVRADVALVNDVHKGRPTLRADVRMLRQVLLNLLSNAVKFTPAQGRVTVSARPGPSGGLDIVIGDTGIGIATEDLARVTEPFQQVGDTLSRSHEGTGLGLFLAQSMVVAHGGELSIESQVGVGTTVTAHFPAERLAPVMNT